MKTLEQIKASYKSRTLDGRDLGRLAMFLPETDLAHFGLELKEGAVHIPATFTRENVLTQLARDLDFAFEKALDKRGISANMMFMVIMMWNWILEEGLENLNEDNSYAYYGLPLFKATALKYNFHNPIGNDVGNEQQYGSD